MERRLSLGLDTSTQSLTAIVIDISSGAVVFEHSLNYLTDGRLIGFGIGDDYLLPPREEGEADQPPQMYLAALDAMFSDMKEGGVDMSSIGVINHSGQQHGHVYLNSEARRASSDLWEGGSGQRNLVEILDGCWAYSGAPIWMTSNTGKQAEFARNRIGGKRKMIELTGSDAPLRFTGAVIRRVGEQFPDEYGATEKIQLISSLIPGILSGNLLGTPWDFGNASGTSLMDYGERELIPNLIEAHSFNLPGGLLALQHKLPFLTCPDVIVGSIAQYFVEKYGFAPGCHIMPGSGDNPQTKVLIEGDLLSLGTSFVNMVSTDEYTRDFDGLANAMYDGVGRPFMFGCRTNGALVWDEVRGWHGLKKREYERAEEALQTTDPGSCLFFYQPRVESFPPSGIIEPTRMDYSEPSLFADYSGIIDSSLAAVYLHSEGFTRETNEPLYVTGRATNSLEIMKRVAAIWNRPVILIGDVGAALGATVAGAHTLLAAKETSFPNIEDISESVLPRGDTIHPRKGDVRAYHGVRGYLRRFERFEAGLIAQNPVG